MADAKISQLPVATSSAGTDVLPIVQSSTTKQLAIENLVPQNLKSNATTGVLQVTGPAAGATRVMTAPDANFTVLYSGGALGTPASGTLTNCTFPVLPNSSMPIGSVVKNSYKGFENSGNQSTTSATYVTSNWSSNSIIPISSNNKINIFMALPFINGTGTGTVTLYRNNTTNIEPTAGQGVAGTAVSNWNGILYIMFQDSPATTSAVFYTLYWKTSAGTIQFRPDVGIGSGGALIQEVVA